MSDEEVGGFDSFSLEEWENGVSCSSVSSLNDDVASSSMSSSPASEKKKKKSPIKYALKNEKLVESYEKFVEQIDRGIYKDGSFLVDKCQDHLPLPRTMEFMKVDDRESFDRPNFLGGISPLFYLETFKKIKKLYCINLEEKVFLDWKSDYKIAKAENRFCWSEVYYERFDHCRDPYHPKNQLKKFSELQETASVFMKADNKQVTIGNVNLSRGYANKYYIDDPFGYEDFKNLEARIAPDIQRSKIFYR